MKNEIIVLIGKSGSGKSTVLNALCNSVPTLHKVTTATSRPMREYEKNHIDYDFFSKEEFTELIEANGFAEYTEFNGWYYGTPKDNFLFNRINVIVLNPQGAASIINTLSNLFNIHIVYVDCSDKERLMRQLNREDNPNCAEICRRFFADAADFDKWLSIITPSLVVNTETQDVDKTCTEILDMVCFR